ncbi:hypothetical protein [Enterococcus faecium]|uniref:hypothetical protein n=1 Tax=Enterococcus faecium TaxID=1352 RepID=UPI000934FBED|nr:hypothetical protein [Enterococcus faecium]
MQQDKDQTLSENDVKKLEQNYIHSDSASLSFVSEIGKLYKSYIEGNITNKDDLKPYFQKIYTLATNINPAALPYAQLTTIIFSSEKNEEATGAFISLLEEFYKNEFTNKKENKILNKSDGTAISVLAKTKEHLSLALNQKNNLYNEQRIELLELKKLLNDERQHLTNLQEQTDNYKEKYDKITIDFLSMMGIFSTIIFAVFGGLSQIGAIGDNLAETPLSKILMYISLSSITLLLIVFISFNAISKLTNLKLKSCACGQEKCACSTKKKHPTLCFSMFFFVDLFLFSLLLRAVRYSDWVQPFTNIFSITSQDSIVKFVLFSLFILFNFIMFIIYCSPLKILNKFFEYIRKFI